MKELLRGYEENSGFLEARQRAGTELQPAATPLSQIERLTPIPEPIRRVWLQ